MADEDCYELLLDGEECGVAELPVEWIRDDAPYFLMDRFGSARPHLAPGDEFDIFRRELDAACEAGGLFQLTLHPHIIAARSRIWILDELLAHAARSEEQTSELQSLMRTSYPVYCLKKNKTSHLH